MILKVIWIVYWISMLKVKDLFNYVCCLNKLSLKFQEIRWKFFFTIFLTKKRKMKYFCIEIYIYIYVKKKWIKEIRPEMIAINFFIQ